tara:strand:+ start:1272 stop:1688 length:417 start_codon:yes stop_codon:yes gene_type:complete
MKLKTINKEHKAILEMFIIEIEGFIYRITDDKSFNAFSNFQPVINNAKQLHNNIGNQLDKMDIDESEWIYMFPNYLLFAGIGFASAIKKNDNEDYINDETEQLFDLISDTIGDLERVMNKRRFVRERLKLKIKNKTND